MLVGALPTRTERGVHDKADANSARLAGPAHDAKGDAHSQMQRRQVSQAEVKSNSSLMRSPLVFRTPAVFDTDLVVGEDFQQEAGDDAGDAGEEVDDDQADVGRAGLVEPERGRVHHWGD